jgi:hypothetical protein
MQSNLLFLNHQKNSESLSLNTIKTAIEKFEATYKTSIGERHRLRFLNGNFGSLKELEKKLAAYRVFGDAGYGDSCFKSS